MGKHVLGARSISRNETNALEEKKSDVGNHRSRLPNKTKHAGRLLETAPRNASTTHPTMVKALIFTNVDYLFSFYRL